MCGSLKMFLEVVINWKIPEISVQFNRLFCATASKQAIKYIVMATIKFSVENGEYKFADISHTNYSFHPNVKEGLCKFTSFHFPDSGIYLSNGFDFYFDLFLMAWDWSQQLV